MKRIWILTAILWLGLCAVTQAQEEPTIIVPMNDARPTVFDNVQDAVGFRHWIQSEYLYWRLEGDPLPPIATSNANPSLVPLGQIPGALGSPGTVVLNPSRMDYDPFSGGRVSAGMFFGGNSLLGIEGSGFLLQTRTAQFQKTANVANNPGGELIGIPFVDATATPAMEEVATFAIPGFANGTINASTQIQLWGAEANGLINLWDSPRFHLTALIGFRYIDLRDDFDMRATANVPAGTIFPASFSISRADHFGTHNQLWGGQLGLRGEVQRGKLFANATAKVLLGDMHQSQDISGATSLQNSGPIFGVPLGFSQFPGGLFAQPSNSGHRTHDTFAVAPEVTANVGVQVTSKLRIFAGYNFLYITDVLRPGNQIDRNVNLSQQLGQPLVGRPVPAPQNNASDFWAHGLNFGVTFTF